MWRELMDSTTWECSHAVKVLLWAVFKANIGQGTFEGRKLKRGQFVTSRNNASAELKMAGNTYLKALEFLVKCGTITVETTRNFTVVTICNYESYQGDGPTEVVRSLNNRVNNGVNHTLDHTLNSKVNHRLNTSKELQESKNISLGETEREKPVDQHPETIRPVAAAFAPPTAAEVAAYAASINRPIDAERFVAHYAAQGWRRGNGQHVTDWQALVPQWVDRPGQAPAAPAPKPISFDRPPQAAPPKPAFWMPEQTPTIPLVREQWWKDGHGEYWEKMKKIVVHPLPLEPHEAGKKPLDFVTEKLFNPIRKRESGWWWMRKQLNCDEPIFEPNVCGLYWAMQSFKVAFQEPPDVQYKALAWLSHRQTAEVFEKKFNSIWHKWDCCTWRVDPELHARIQEAIKCRTR
jgi:hypothetical protein